MNAAIEAHYARVSPDTSPPLLRLALAIDCAVVEQHTSTLLAGFGCEEPADLGSGVASCVATDAAGAVQNGDPLDTSTIGTHDFIVTAVDNAGNERSRTFTRSRSHHPRRAGQNSAPGTSSRRRRRSGGYGSALIGSLSLMRLGPDDGIGAGSVGVILRNSPNTSRAGSRLPGAERGSGRRLPMQPREGALE